MRGKFPRLSGGMLEGFDDLGGLTAGWEWRMGVVDRVRVSLSERREFVAKRAGGM